MAIQEKVSECLSLVFDAMSGAHKPLGRELHSHPVQSQSFMKSRLAVPYLNPAADFR
jgi:hypothetical protein